MSVSLGVAARPPLEAWLEDSGRAGVGAIAEEAASWVLVATTLWRIGQLPVADRLSALSAGAETLRRIAGTSPLAEMPRAAGGPTAVTVVEDTSIQHRVLLQAMADGASRVVAAIESRLDDEHEREAWETFATAVQDAASALERAGAFALADSALAATSTLLPAIAEQALGRLWAQRGRVARQTGSHAAAQALYESADRIGRRRGDVDLRSRATIGLGAVAMARGNYPEARVFFRRVIRWSRPDTLRQHRSAAHQGLFAAALAADDCDTALRHGWLAFQLAESGPDRQAELVGMLAQLALRVGDSKAALQAYRVSCSLTADVRLRLIAYGGMATAAARSQSVSVLDEAQRDATAMMTRSSHTYENTFVLYELAAANAELGRMSHATRFADAAERSAREHAVYEIVHRVDALRVELEQRSSLDRAGASPPRRSIAPVRAARSPGRADSLRELEVHGSESSGTPTVSTGVVLTAPSRRVLRSLHALQP